MIGNRDRNIIPRTTRVKLSATTGIFPKKNHSDKNKVTQQMPPKAL